MNKEKLLDVISEIRGQTKKINESLEKLDDYVSETKYFLEKVISKTSSLCNEVGDIDNEINELENILQEV